MSSKFALIIGNTEYTDPKLVQLSAPGKDTEDFARVLGDREIGAFDKVEILLNQPSYVVNEAIDGFFSEKKPDDLLVLYFSGHGMRDEFGALYLAVKNTFHSRLRSTAIKSDYIRDAMDQSRSKRQVLILDCCMSGAFSQGTKAAGGASIGTASAFEAGYGRIVLTASDSMQFAWEGDKIIGETDNSLFTHYLVRGLEGEADQDGDGRITVDELYDYAYEKVRLATPKQTPSKFSSKQQGEIILRQSTRAENIKPLPLSAELMDEIEDTRPYVREAAVQKLEKILKGKNIGMARSASEALEKIIADENTTRRVAQAAMQVLESIRQAGELTIQKEAENQKIVAEEEARRIELQKQEGRRVLHEREAQAQRQENEKAERFIARKAEQDRLLKAKMEAESTAIAPEKVKQKSPPGLVDTLVEKQRLRPFWKYIIIAIVAGLLLLLIVASGGWGIPFLSYILPEITDNKGVEMVLVSASVFGMGSDNDDSDMKPYHMVYLDPYYIDKYEVTNSLYETCVTAGVCKPPQNFSSATRPNYYGNSAYDNFPVIYVDWNMAKTFCEWRGAELPTEAQWEKAARGMEDPSIYSWGAGMGCDNANFCTGDTSEVGSYENGKSPYGAYDMAGNVWEWVADKYSAIYYQDSPEFNPSGPFDEEIYYRVLRGGAWDLGEKGVPIFYRLAFGPDTFYEMNGFRCVRSTP